MDEQLKQSFRDFIKLFELVFDHDWEHTIEMLKEENIDSYIDATGTFLKPKVDDEYSNWANRGSLLDAYKDVISKLQL